jgi:hypothetical protein
LEKIIRDDSRKNLAGLSLNETSHAGLIGLRVFINSVQSGSKLHSENAP